MAPELGKLKLYTMFLYHSSSEMLHLHQSSALDVTFCKTMKQSLCPYLLHTPSKGPHKMWDADHSRDLSSSDTGRLLTNQDGTDLSSDQSCLDLLVQDCTVNHPPLNEPKVVWHAQLHVCFGKKIIP